MMFYKPTRSFVAGLVLGLALFGMFTAIAIYFTVQIPVALNPPLIVYSDVVMPADASLCEGDVLGFSALVHITRPSLPETFVSIRDAKTLRTAWVPDADERSRVRVQPTEAQFRDTYTFTVPSLPAGPYEYLRGTIPANEDAEPSFLVVPFVVKDCKEGR